ncbi:hypothetical protein OC25_09670 [Pedobacter kyungheensis]|uniref:Uncharacterized protein n=1 Tax=Pedobacter kyungheensis TaxID=1069985 RepID=A0A0C1FR10_9SPHI|nr:hypothetical protein [Pedobacter kyungheensis]KIA94198.1 hypothetical protein OC25_09670 [Pedobacter kyungheensis]
MKQALLYSAKVTITTLVLCLPVTFAVMMAYIRSIPLISGNYNFQFNFNISDGAVFVVMAFTALLFYSKKMAEANAGIYNKHKITNRAFLTSVIVFIVYLLVFGKLDGYPFSGFLVTYGPSFLIMFICMKAFPLRNDLLITGGVEKV